MAIESSRRRTTLRVGSALAAAVAGSAVVAVVARRRAASTPRPALPIPDERRNGADLPARPTPTPVAAAPAPALVTAPPPVAAAPAPAVAPPPVVAARAPVVAPPPVDLPPAPVDEPVRAPVPPAPPPYVAPRPLPPPSDPGPERRWWPLAVGAVAAVVVLVLAAFVFTGGDDGPSEATDADTRAGVDTTVAPPTTTVDDLTPDAAFEQAAARLEAAGTYAYGGSSLATDVSPVRPGLWLTVELTMGGEVDLRSGRLHDVGETTVGRITETVTDGTIVWGRLADSRDDLPDEGFLTVGDPAPEPLRLGAALLPTWLLAGVDRQELSDGRFRATLLPEVLGEVESGRDPVPAELLLTLDAAGDPLHVEITNATEGPPLHLVLDLTTLGQPVTIPLPSEPSPEDAGQAG